MAREKHVNGNKAMGNENPKKKHFKAFRKKATIPDSAPKPSTKKSEGIVKGKRATIVLLGCICPYLLVYLHDDLT